MIRRQLAFVLALGLLVVMAPGASAQNFVEHPHMLVIGLELDEFDEPVGFRKCVDLAAGEALPLNSMHQHMHFGTAGEMLFTKAGHAVVPAAPFPEPFGEAVPWSNCEELIAFFFGG